MTQTRRNRISLSGARSSLFGGNIKDEQRTINDFDEQTQDILEQDTQKRVSQLKENTGALKEV